MYCGFRELFIICDITARERPCCSISFSSRKHSLVFSGGTSKTIVICESEATTTPNWLKHLGQVTTNPPKLNSSSAIFSRSACIKSPLTSSVPHFRQRISFNSSHLQHFSPRNPLQLKFCKRTFYVLCIKGAANQLRNHLLFSGLRAENAESRVGDDRVEDLRSRKQKRR